jgi:ferrous iron transport protein A
MEKPLTELKLGEEGTIVAVQGGRGMQVRLRNMGLVEGQVIRKVSALAWGGPVVVVVKRTQVAIGRGMARRILVRCRNGEDSGNA